MSKANLLNTRTINYLELIGNGKSYRVPAYQRDYSWSVEHWEDLWSDVLDLRTKPDDRHYMGSLVVQGESDREFLIIDGQQRLATLSVLALAVIAKLTKLAEQGQESESNLERASELRKRFIGEKDPASLIESSRLRLNETDDGFYQDYLVQVRQPRNPRGLPRSNRRLWDCFRYFTEQIGELGSEYANGIALARLLSETVARQLLFILITVDDELNAYKVFETLNARGLELTTTDLLKNYLFSRVPVAADREALQRRWRVLIATVGQERFPELLRYHLLCEFPKIRSERLFKIVRQRAVTSAEVFALLDALEGRAELFSAISDPNHGYWQELPEAKASVREISLFRVRQMTPLLFAAWERFSPQDFARVLKLVSIVSFRYTVVSGLNTNALEPAYHLAAKSVLDGTARSASDVFARLKDIYVDDKKFEQDFALLDLGTGGSRKRLVKYILARLEQDLSGRPCDPETDSGSIEHILPENPADGWQDSFPSALWESSVYRIGNLTLLEPAKNRTVGNAPYRQKSATYRTSAYSLTRRLAEIAPDRWSLELLDTRQRELAARAVHTWRSDFA